MSSLIIAAAGAGKTTFLVDQALKIPENILITTYTDANEQSIRDKFYELHGCVPANVTIMPWFSLLIKHGIRPYQSYLIKNRVSGVLLVNKADQNLLRLKDSNEKKYVTASGNGVDTGAGAQGHHRAAYSLRHYRYVFAVLRTE